MRTVYPRFRSVATQAPGLTQIEAAQRMGKPQSYISKCEAGERRIDAIEAVAFAAAYDVSLDELLFGLLPEDRKAPI